MNKIILFFFLTSQIIAEWGPEGYVPDNSIQWDQIIPLIKALLPFLFIIGVPVIITVIIYVAVQILKYGGKWCVGFAKDLSPHEGD